MSRFRLYVMLALCLHLAAGQSNERRGNASGHYLFVWAGDAAGKGNDFLSVIDANPNSPSYGKLVTTLATDQQTMLVHHTELHHAGQRYVVRQRSLRRENICF